MKERLNLMDNIEIKAWYRQQSEDPQKESLCASCGEQLNPLAFNSMGQGGFFATWRKSIQDGGMRTSENCVLLCSKCYQKLRPEKNLKEIPMRKLIFFRRKD